MAKNIVSKDVSLEDVFYLISLFENDLNSHLDYVNCNMQIYNEDLIKMYVDIQDNFFYELSRATNITQIEIEDKFKEYVVNVKENNCINKNYSLKFLSEDKAEYLKERERALNIDVAPSIRNVQEVYNKNNVKKVYN